MKIVDYIFELEYSYTIFVKFLWIILVRSRVNLINCEKTVNPYIKILISRMRFDFNLNIRLTLFSQDKLCPSSPQSLRSPPVRGVNLSDVEFSD